MPWRFLLTQVSEKSVEIYGTRHSLSYLVANARVFDKRCQNSDIIAQVQYGIRVFELTVRLEAGDKPVMANTLMQKMARGFWAFFQIQSLDYDGQPVYPMVTTNSVDTDLSVWHVFAILNQTARHGNIAKLIVVINFVNKKSPLPLAGNKAAERQLLAQLQAGNFSHLFIVLLSDLPRLFDDITDAPGDCCFSVKRKAASLPPVNDFNEENRLINKVINRQQPVSTPSWQGKPLRLVWLPHFDPWVNCLFPPK